MGDALRWIEELRARLEAEQVTVTIDVIGVPVTLTVGRGGLRTVETPAGVYSP